MQEYATLSLNLSAVTGLINRPESAPSTLCLHGTGGCASCRDGS